MHLLLWCQHDSMWGIWHSRNSASSYSLLLLADRFPMCHRSSRWPIVRLCPMSRTDGCGRFRLFLLPNRNTMPRYCQYRRRESLENACICRDSSQTTARGMWPCRGFWCWRRHLNMLIGERIRKTTANIQFFSKKQVLLFGFIQKYSKSNSSKMPYTQVRKSSLSGSVPRPPKVSTEAHEDMFRT